VKIAKWFAVSALVISGVSAAVPTVVMAASEPGADVNFILELAPGENPEVHVDWLLDKVGVSESDRDSRIVPVYDDYRFFRSAINGAWLRLTGSEASEAAAITQAGIVNAQVAFDVSVPLEPFGQAYDPDGMAGTPMTGSQEVPSGYLRVGAEPGDYSDVDVAVLDTGVDNFQSDLNVVGGFDCTYEGRAGLRPADSWRRDYYGHGTHVAGTIAALDNDRGTLGIAPGARIWSIPVLGDDGGGSMASLLCGVEHVADQATTIDVYNMSLGGGNDPSECWSWDSLHNAFCTVDALGVEAVVSAGNSSTDAITSSPANYAENTTVSALTDFDGLPGGLASPPEGIPPEYKDDAKALFSNYGAVVDVIAPGVQILSTTPNDTVMNAHGTSMAAPHVTGVFAAWIAQNPRDRAHVAEAVLAYSVDVWDEKNTWTGDIGPDHEPLVRFGAPEWVEVPE
jgi:subtilisin family serine protease